MRETPASSNYEALARRFRRFAEVECRGSSPLYEHLALAIAADEALLALAAHAPQGPVPNLFLAAVHLLLLQGEADPLAQFYPSLTPAAAPPAAAYAAFRAFCMAHADALRHLLLTRRVQTNEVGRCACLFPAFALVATLAHERPLALLEIGASAGLNLMWDHYGYDYGPDAAYGAPQSSVQLACTWRGHKRPTLPRHMPRVALRVGIDLQVVDLRDADQVLWLRALVWPEHRQRALVLQRTIDIARRNPPQMLMGDGVALLSDVIRSVPEELAVCVFHTHTINQFSPPARHRLSALLAEHGNSRDLFRVSVEWLGTSHPQLELTAWHSGQAQQRLLAYCDPHGRWLEWLDNGTGKIVP